MSDIHKTVSEMLSENYVTYELCRFSILQVIEQECRGISLRCHRKCQSAVPSVPLLRNISSQQPWTFRLTESLDLCSLQRPKARWAIQYPSKTQKYSDDFFTAILFLNLSHIQYILSFARPIFLLGHLLSCLRASPL